MPRIPVRTRRMVIMAAMIGLSLLFIVPGAVLLAQGQTLYLPHISKEIAPPPTATPQPTPTEVPDQGWAIEYRNNVDLAGDPVFSTIENTPFVEKEWGTGGPGNGVNNDRFSARFTRQVWFDPGTYQFVLTMDDYGRLFIDNMATPVIDAWHGSTRGTHSGAHTVTFTSGGYHVVRVEYAEYFQTARVRLWWHDALQYPGWYAEYYNNENLSGSPAVMNEPSLAYRDYGTGAPSGVQSDHFSARFTRAFYLPDSGAYWFTLTADDGARVWIDKWAPDQHAMNKWDGAHNTTSWVEIMEAGWYVFRVEYRDVTGEAWLDFRFQFGGTFNENGFRAKYYGSTDFGGGVVHEQDESLSSWTKDTNDWMTSETLSLDWGTGSPPNTPSDYFSARFYHTFRGLPGRYRLTIRGDDYVRLYVDGVQRFDGWGLGGRTFEDTVDLVGDWHHVLIEYQEVTQEANLEFSWQHQ